MIDWEAYTDKTSREINLLRAVRTEIHKYEKLPPEDKAMVEELVTEVLYLQPLKSRQVAGVALVMIRQSLIQAQILGEILGQMGVVLKSAEAIQVEKNRSAIKVVSSNRMPKEGK